MRTRDCSERLVSHKKRKKLRGLDHFFKMRSTKCERDCRESLVSHKNGKMMGSDHFLKMNSTKCARDCS